MNNLFYRKGDDFAILRDKIYSYFFSNQNEAPPYLNELNTLRNHSNNFYDVVFPYDLTPINFKIIEDSDKLFSAEFNEKIIHIEKEAVSDPKSYLEGIAIEQAVGSPHNYKSLLGEELSGDILIDCGAAEGWFSLSLVDKFKTVCLIEEDIMWIKHSLLLTFKDYKNCQVIHGSLGRDNDLVTMFSEIGENETALVKMDIEGWEVPTLLLNESLLDNKNISFLICCYHRQNDADTIKLLAEKHGREYRFSEGYMLFPLDTLFPPFFRKGLIYIK